MRPRWWRQDMAQKCRNEKERRQTCRILDHATEGKDNKICIFTSSHFNFYLTFLLSPFLAHISSCIAVFRPPSHFFTWCFSSANNNLLARKRRHYSRQAVTTLSSSGRRVPPLFPAGAPLTGFAVRPAGMWIAQEEMLGVWKTPQRCRLGSRQGPGRGGLNWPEWKDQNMS